MTENDDPSDELGARQREYEAQRAVLERIRARDCDDLWRHIALLPRDARRLATDYAIQSGYDPRYPELPSDDTVLESLREQAEETDARNRVRRYSDLPRDKVPTWMGEVRRAVEMLRTVPTEFQAFFWVDAELWQGASTGTHGRSTVLRHFLTSYTSLLGRRICSARRHPSHGFWLTRGLRPCHGGRLVGSVALHVDAPQGICYGAVDAYGQWLSALRRLHLRTTGSGARYTWRMS